MSNGTQISDFSRISLLIAEQTPYMRIQIHSILQRSNIGEVIEANTPDQAWHIFRSHQPDMVFVDWAPGFDGISLLQRIRRDKASANPFTPVLVVTAHTEHQHSFTARDLCMTEFLAKPFSPQRVLQRLQNIAEHPRNFGRANTYFGVERRVNRTGSADMPAADNEGDGPDLPIKIDTEA